MAAAVLLNAGSAAARSARAAALHNPTHNCTRGYLNQQLKRALATIDRCRVQEGLGQLELPTNYHRLTPARRMFVLLNLARVNRGLAPIVGLSASLDAIARRAADAESDPAFPGGYFSEGGALWAFTPDVMSADEGWMYDDGWGRAVFNSACTSPHASGCWAHREIILMRSRQRLVAGGGARSIHVPGMGTEHSYAFEILAGYSRRHLVFTWRHELRYFKQRPRLELLSRNARLRR